MTEATRARLLAGGSDRFVDLLLDDVLDRPLGELLDPDWLAAQLITAARSAAADSSLEEALREQVAALRASPPSGPPNLPAEVLVPLREVVGRAYVPDRDLMVRLLDHDTVRQLLQHLFTDTLVAFAKRVRPGGSSGLGQALGGSRGAFGALGKLGGGIVGAVGEEVERQVEQKAREFMQEAVHRLAVRTAEGMSDPRRVGEYGAWRAHALDVLTTTDLGVLASEVEKLDPDSLVRAGAAIVRAYVGRAATEVDLQSVLRRAVEGGGTLREALGGAEVHALGLVRDMLRQRARALVSTPAFEAWWDEMNG